MADNLRKYTTQEVLNKVFTDTSGNAIGVNSSTTKETLNAVFSTSDNSLNVALSGGTISGDVTISGDLTVQGDGTNSFDEIIQGTVQITGDGGTMPTLSAGTNLVVAENSAASDGVQIALIAGTAGIASIDFGDSGDQNDGAIFYDNNDRDLNFRTGGSGTDMTIDVNGKIGVGTVSPSGKLTLSNGSASAPLSITASNSYIQLGSEDFGSGGLGKFMIGFGYTDVLTNTNAPAYIGFEETSTSGDTKGDLTFYTRDVTTDTAPTKRLTIGADGDATFAGDILVANATPSLSLQDTDGTNQISELLTSGATTYLSLRNGSSHGSLVIRGYNGSAYSTALTIGSDQSATFANDVITEGKYQISNATPELLFAVPSGGLDSRIHNDGSGNLIFGNGTNSTTPTEAMRIDSSQNIGIGASPTEKLTIFGGSGSPASSGTGANGNLAVESSNGNSLYIGSYSASPFGVWLQTSNYTDQSLAYPLILNPNGGNVGIGTISPIAGSSKTVLTISDSAQALLVFEDTGFESSGDGLGMFAYNDGTLTYRTASRSGTDFTGSTNRLVIDANSRISISNNDSGTSNTIFGKNAGLSLDDGSNYNVFVGENVSDASMNDAQYNVGVGYDALTALTSGDSNIAVGAFALADNTTARFNTAIGGATLQRNIDGEHNTALGYVAGKFSAAGASNVTSPDQCTIIGSLAEFSSATPTNQIVIGYGADGLADNSVTLGNSDVNHVYMAQDSGATIHAGGIRIGSPTTTSFATNIKASSDVLSLEADGTGGPQLRMTDTSSTSNDDVFGLIDFSAKDAGDNQLVMNRILNKITDTNTSSTDSELSIYAMSNDTLTETVRIGSGRLYLPQGQIGFPASQNASSDANTLDDYEEGEHTATVTCGNSGTITLDGTNNKLSYVKIGSMVTVNGLLSVSSVSSPDGYFTFSVPFTLGDGTGLSKRCSGSVTVYGVSGLDVNQFVVVGIEAEARIRVYAGNATSIVNDSANALVASSAILVSITYFV